MRDALHSWYKENEELGDRASLPKWIVNGDIYTYAYAMAQAQVAHPALQALDLTYQSIANRCGGEDIALSDITTVFSRISAGLNLRYLLEAKRIVWTIQDYPFNDSCKAVYKCYYRTYLEEQLWDDFDAWDQFTDEVNTTCRNVVDELFMIMYERTRTLESMKNLNYGDELLANAKQDDGPFDLLADVEAIWNILFSHNDPPAEIHFYTVEPLDGYVSNDPDKLTPYPLRNPEDEERLDRLPPTAWRSPTIPQDSDDIYPPEPFLPLWTDLVDELQYPIGPQTLPTTDWLVGSEPVELPSNTILWNVFCEIPLEDEVIDEPILERALQENDQTTTYNRKLDLDDEIAVALGAKFSPEIEEWFGYTFRGAWGEIFNPTPPVQQEVETIVNELLDLGWETLEETKTKIQQCVADFTNEKKDAWGKVLFKSITQPAEFTKCVFWHLCKEISDPSWRWFFHIKICRELRKGHGLISVQPVKSIEEIVDEMLNVCTTMKESGALLEHNKTKDHLDHKLMRLKLWNKFAFGISVIFASPEDAVDPAIAKAKAIDRREYLESLHLDVSDDLTFVTERNKYLLLQDKRSTRMWFEANNIVAQNNQLSVESANTSDVATPVTTPNPSPSSTDLQQTTSISFPNNRWLKSQLMSNATTISAYQLFLLENIQMRDVINQYTDSMNKKRKTTYDRFQASPGK